ncbi:hypothetical protein A2U01_0119373, partial [Trifolium medium]|nr:hypothetical protein [Trifolium medium]
MDPQQTYNNGTGRRIGTRKGFMEERLWQSMLPKRMW